MTQKPIQRGLMGLLAVLMVAGMGYSFIPGLHGGGSLTAAAGTPALKVNGETVTAQELATLKKGNQVLASTDSGVLGDDFKTVVVARAIQNALYKAGSKEITVSRADVDAQVKKTREDNKLTDNKAWTDALQGIGMSDSSYRQQVRDGMAIQRKVEAIQKAAPAATDAEAQAYYALNKDQYQNEARIVGREIVVADKARAEDLLKQLKAGADFAKLAAENSLENKDRGGALGALENGAPKPVTAVVLPADVATPAFALTQGGLSGVVSSGGRFYIVKVEKYLAPTPKAFEEAKTDILSALTQQKKDAALEAWTDSLQKEVKVEYLDPAWTVADPDVASVAGHNIKYSEVVAQMVGNQQVAAILQQMPPEQVAGMLNTGFKPELVEQLITTYAAPNIAKNLGLNLVGNRQEIATVLAQYGARDVKVSDAEIQKTYQDNIKAFETPASAAVTEASFKDNSQAAAFRADWNGSGDFTAAATKAGATVAERGTVAPSTPQAPGTLDKNLETAVFTGQLRNAGEGSLSSVVPVGSRFVVAYVTDFKKAMTKPLSEVRDQIEQQALQTKKGSASREFLKTEVAKLNPVDNLKTVLADQAKRVAAAEKAAPSTPATPDQPATGQPATPGATTPAAAAPATK